MKSKRRRLSKRKRSKSKRRIRSRLNKRKHTKHLIESLNFTKQMLNKLSIRKKPKNDGGGGVFTIFALEGCTYCHQAEKFLKTKKQSVVSYEFKKLPIKKQKEIMSKIINQTGKTYEYYPMIFLDNKFIGGFQDLQQMF